VSPNLTNWLRVSWELTLANSPHAADLLLLHKLRIGAVVNHTLAEDWRTERAVNLLRVGVLQLRVEHEVVPFRPQAYSRLFPK